MLVSTKFKKITDEEFAKYWLLNNYGSFINKIQSECKIENTLGHALYCYTGSMSNYYNNFVYEVKGNVYSIKPVNDIFGDTLTNIIKIHEAFKINRISENIILYHYISIRPNILLKTIYENNNEFCLNRFMSTTILKDCEGIKKLIRNKHYNILFEIKVKKDINCIPILWKNEQSHLSEYEIILEPTIRLKLTKIRKKYFSSIEYVFEFEVLE